MKNQDVIINALLSLEHRNTAKRLGFIQGEKQLLSMELVKKAIYLLDVLTIQPTDESKKKAIVLSAIVWTYRPENVEGLKDFLIKIFSRIGFAPSSIMVDESYDKQSASYSPVISFMDQVATVAHQITNEIILNGKIYLLTDFQKRVWESISLKKFVGISAPTSAGKSFVIALKTMELLQQQTGDIVYIVPTISLVSQVTVDYRQLLKNHDLNDVQILNTFIRDVSSERKIYVLTQEKAIAAFSSQETPFENLLLLVIDEIQNIERVGSDDDQRAKTLFDMIVEFREACNPKHIIISGPRITKIGKLGTDLTGVDSTEEATNNSPVSNFTYSILKTAKKSFFKLYPGITANPLSIQIEDDSYIPKPGSAYNENVHSLIYGLLLNLGEDSVNIVFSPTSSQSENTAKFLANRISDSSASDPLMDSLINYITDTVHPKYALNDVLRSRITFHHGRMPHHVRRVIEKAINQKMVNNIVCTTTLMQGVNLPAQNVIVRNPNLYTRKHGGNDPSLTDYELANLRGRAGRLLKDFVGRTIILEEEKFTSTQGNDMFAEASKELTSGYGTAFKEYKNSVLKDLSQGAIPAESNKDYAFLSTYVRQLAIKYPNDFVSRLSRVGISLTTSQAQDVSDQISSLQVPKTICFRNRYWDPIVLNELYLRRNQIILPTGVSEYNIEIKLENAIEWLRVIVPYYVDKHFSIKNTDRFKLLTSACINATKWLKETPLAEILDQTYYDDSEKIRKAIKLLQNDISHNLPALLQPIYDAKYPDSSFLRFIELGAYNPITRKLIEHSIPRETAISLKDKFFKTIDTREIDFKNSIVPVLKENYNKLDHWTKVQLEVLF